MSFLYYCLAPQRLLGDCSSKPETYAPTFTETVGKRAVDDPSYVYVSGHGCAEDVGVVPVDETDCTVG